MVESLEALTNKANVALKKSVDYQVQAGIHLRELKARVTDKASDEGREWDFCWSAFVAVKLSCSKSRANQLIQFAEADNPELAITAYNEKAADRMRKIVETRPEASGRFDKIVSNGPSLVSIDRQVDRLTAAWDEASPEAREHFMALRGLYQGE